MQGRATALAAAVLWLGCSASSSAEPEDAAPPGETQAASGEDQPIGGRTELGVVPILAYNSDLGFGAGAIFNVARTHPEASPYRWRLRVQSLLHLNPSPDFGPVLTFQAHALVLDLPELASGRLRLEAALLASRRSTASWYGLGNASTEQRPWESLDRLADPAAYAVARRHHRYDHAQVALHAVLRARLVDRLAAVAGLEGSWNEIEAYPGSLLELEASGASGEQVADRIVGLGQHGLVVGTLGLSWDGRDDRVDPRKGGYHEVSIRGGPVIGADTGFGGLHGVLRFYLPLGGRAVLALRALADVLLGSPPVHLYGLLPGLPQVPAIGGSRSLRGPPAQRWQGAVRLLGTAELRTWLGQIVVRRSTLEVGLAGGLDIGRVWAGLSPDSELDGANLGLKLGLSAGLRLLWGRAFVLRVDGAWSPDGMGVYFDAGQVF